MPVINFFEEGISFELKHKRKLKQWIKDTIAAEGYQLDELSYIFCSDTYLLAINQHYLDHDTYTDIVTFDNSEAPGQITGDIFISVDRIRENAEKFNQAFIDELHRVMIHGALHLLGYKDKKPAEKQKMTEMEDFYLNKRQLNA
jgi:rRNA maturation RNase YbeY